MNQRQVSGLNRTGFSYGQRVNVCPLGHMYFGTVVGYGDHVKNPLCVRVKPDHSRVVELWHKDCLKKAQAGSHANT